jgi:hypothetical protein
MADDKKIIIDEDWKAQVQAEKEQAAKAKASEPASGGPASAGEAAGATTEREPHDHDPPMPPASFEMLLSTLATEALVALGAVPHPVTGHQHAQPNQARFLIDTLDVLKQKTKGNLSPAEEQLLESLLHQLRMVFVELTNRSAAAGSTN